MSEKESTQFPLTRQELEKLTRAKFRSGVITSKTTAQRLYKLLGNPMQLPANFKFPVSKAMIRTVKSMDSDSRLRFFNNLHIFID